ncbi:MAG: hypothetical protein JW993_00990 [Sedimentisphaerales bacterium]|nr:hypothetical protein [Sedimentisphaerales bacterium]
MERRWRVGIVLSVCLVEAFCACAWAKYGGGSGTADDPYLISTPEHLLAMMAEQKDHGRHFRLMEDIDLAGCTSDQYQIIGVNWQGLFSGVFDGNGKTISNFTYTCADVNCVGLFGLVGDDARIENLGLIDPNVSAAGCTFVGSLAGECRGTVVDCYVTNARVSGMSQVGGLVGGGMRLSDCHAGGIVSGIQDVGGLAGCVWETANCCSATADVVGVEFVGGLTGTNHGRIAGCFSAGTASGDAYVGGLVGTTGIVIANCYSTCDVNGYDWVGGLIGAATWGGVTANSYCTGKVVGSQRVGGLIGRDYSRSAGTLDAIRGCFWDTQSSGLATSDGGAGLATAQMQTLATFLDAGWDFVGETANGTNDLWQMPGRRACPRLCWEQIPIGEPNDSQFGPPRTDDFEDGLAEPLWSVYEPTANVAWLMEANGRLEVLTVGYAGTANALYVSNGWTLDATTDFFLKIGFRFDAVAEGEGWVSLGLTPDANNPQAEYIELAAGYLDGESVYLARQSVAGWRQRWWANREQDSGTLYLSYDAAKDELYLSDTGYGREDTWHIMSELVRGKWAGQPLHIVIGGSATAMTLNGLDAWLDNFAVDSGMTVW